MSQNKVQESEIRSNNPVVQGLQNTLRASYSLFLMSHNYHWNIEGENFVPLHALFEEQYNELFAAIDEIAEHIRALDDYALPFQDERIMKEMLALNNPLTSEEKSDKRALMMVENLILLTDKVIQACQETKRIAVEAEDDETEDLMINRIQVHQKNNWMLKSIVKK